MHYYHHSYEEVLALPIGTFWLMSASIERIAAQQDLRSLAVAVCSYGGEVAMAHQQRLVMEVGTVTKTRFDPMSERLDRTGFAKLKAMAQQQ